MSWPSIPTEAGRRAVRPDEPLLVLSPRFSLAAALVAGAPVALFFSAWVTLFFGGSTTFALHSLGADHPAWAPFAVAGAASLVVTPLLVAWAIRAGHARTEYRFYPTEVEVDEGRVDAVRRTLPLASVSGVDLRRSAVQERAGLGTLVLRTASPGGRLRLADVADPEVALEEVRRVVAAAAGPVAQRDAATARPRTGEAAA